MKITYKRIDLRERIIIEKSLALGHTYQQIGVSIGYHKSSICRDNKRCKKLSYSAMEATRLAVGNSFNRRGGKCKIVQQKPLGKIVFEKFDLR